MFVSKMLTILKIYTFTYTGIKIKVDKYRLFKHMWGEMQNMMVQPQISQKLEYWVNNLYLPASTTRWSPIAPDESDRC